MYHCSRAAVARPVTVYMHVVFDMPLHHFKFVDFVFGGGVPDGRGIFKCWSNIVIGLATVWSGITSKKTEGAIGFLGDGMLWFQDSLLLVFTPRSIYKTL